MATRRMNEMWRRMALALVLCVLLFHSSHAEDPKDATDPTRTAPANVSTISPASDQTAGAPQTNQTGATEQANSSLAPGESPTTPPSGEGGLFIGSSPDEIMKIFASLEPEPVPTAPQAKIMEVNCVGKEKVLDRSVVKVQLIKSSTCEATKAAIVANHEALCDKPSCSFEIFQEDDTKNVIVTGKSIEGDVVGMSDKITALKAGLGVESAMPEHGKSSPAVFVSLLVTGLVVAAALIGAYLWKNNRRTNSKGMKLANESVMADEENQGNTLVSVAPLNPPQEAQEKPSLNGESQEAVKPQNPPAATNGHSATKTADTEL
ncbi:uncharacterized protein cd34 [Astyanax mexicanus]|uniref:uncharacterized protein cd34 n=1 Tax=Astyanax mexicanus TaxID=7994 RepID=UPI0020CB5066|nr:uncharacterized protein cd34 [Astyanax mexicanus]